MVETKMGKIEAIFLIMTIIINHIILNLPSEIISSTSSAAPINIIFISILALFFVFLIGKLFKNFPELDILDISEFLGGKWLKFAFGILFFLYFIATASVLLRSLAENLQIIYFPKTHIAFLLLLFIFAISITVKLGFSSISKANLIIMPIVLISILFVFIANLSNFTILRMTPILGNGFNSTFLSGMSNLFAFSGIAYLYFIPPMLSHSQHYKKIAYISIILSAIFLFLSTSTILFIFPFVAETQEVFPLYVASRFIEFGRFFQRLDAFFLLIWIISMVSYLSIVISFCLTIIRKITKISYPTFLVPLLCLTIFGVGLLPQNITQIHFLETTVYKYVVLILIFGITPLLLLLANLKRIRLKKEMRKGDEINESPI